MAEPKKHVYDESKIKTLSSLEHIRLRTGMYIGRIGDGSHYDDGCYILLKEVIDNAIDEFIMGAGKEVQIIIQDKEVTVRDFGLGIPLGKVVDCVSKINTGAKYNDDVFQFSVGLNGVGTKAVNALSKVFLVRSHRSGEYVELLPSSKILRPQLRSARVWACSHWPAGIRAAPWCSLALRPACAPGTAPRRPVSFATALRRDSRRHGRRSEDMRPTRRGGRGSRAASVR